MNIHQELSIIRTGFQRDADTIRGTEMQVQSLQQSVARFQTDLERLEQEEVLHQKVLLTFKEISDSRTAQGKDVLERMLNWALANIPLEQRYEAQLVEGVRGTKKEMSIILRDLDTGHVRNLKNQSGTALVQIISFLMNIIVIILSNSSRIMLLDECFSGIQDQDTILMFGDILVALAENEGFQFIMVEHKSELSNVEGIITIQASLEDYEQGTKYQRIN